MKVAKGGSNGIDTTSQMSDVAANHAGSSAMTGKTAVIAVASSRRVLVTGTQSRLDTMLSTLTE
jgi:hypothetical protein